ncbi:MAG: DinB family protein [Gemmatimonadota bacterium]|nr:DinB family protein [Gemmatimonadota bacterium]
MTNNGLPCLDLLQATPGILRGLMIELTDEDARWKPSPDRFSIAEVLAHLSHSESHCYRMRVDRFMAETCPEFEPDDAQMYLELYRNANPQESFDHFEELRENNIEFLRGIPAQAGDRIALHTGDCQFGGLVHFHVPDADLCYRQFRDNGVPVSEPPGNSVGPDTRNMIVVDPDGNRLSFITRSTATFK